MPAANIPGLTDSQLLAALQRGAAQNSGYNLYSADHHQNLANELGKRRGWSDAELARVRTRRVWIGASREQVLCSWGPPKYSEESLLGDSELAAWTYPLYGRGWPQVIYLRDGFVIALSEP